MLGIKTNCELVHAYVGFWSGLFAGFLMLTQTTAPLNDAAGFRLALLTGLFAVFMVALLFCVLYRQSFTGLFFPLLVPGLVLGVIIYALMMLLPSPIGQPFLLVLIGVVLGVVMGRAICALCSRDKIAGIKG